VKLNDGVDPDLEVQKILTAEPDVEAFTLGALAHSANIRFAGLLNQFAISGALVWGGAVLLVSATTTLSVRESRGSSVCSGPLGRRGLHRGWFLSQSVIVTAMAGALGIIVAYALFDLLYARIIAGIGVSYISPPATEIATILLASMGGYRFHWDCSSLLACEGGEQDGALRRAEAR